MKLGTICLLVFIFAATVNATLTKGRAKVYTLPDRVPFAVLYDSSFVLQTWGYKPKQCFIEFDGFVKTSDIKNGRLKRKYVKIYGELIATDEFSLSDTVYLYSDTSLKKIAGYIWRQPKDSSCIGFYDVMHNPDCLGCYIDGGIDSTSILDFDPWYAVINSILKNRNLFETRFRDLKRSMLTRGGNFSDICGKGGEYYETIDEEDPEPDVVLLYFFHNGVLRAMWANRGLKIESGERFHGGYIYYDGSVKSSLSKIERKFKAILDYTG